MMDPVSTPEIPGRHARRSWLLVSVVGVAVLAAGLGGYFGFRAVTHGNGGAASGSAMPAPRAGAAMAYDAANRTVVMFGGRGAAGDLLADTWVWDGASWTEQHPANAPPARVAGLMAYDPQGHDIVLFGGQPSAGAAVGSGGVAQPQASPPVVATWLWDGTNWTPHAGARPPDPAPSSQMATDPATGRVVLVDGPGPRVLPAQVCPLGPPVRTSPDASCSGPPIAAALTTWVWQNSAWVDTHAASPTAASAAVPGLSSALVADPRTGRLALLSTTPMIAACPATIAPPPASGTPPQTVPPIPCPVTATATGPISVVEWTGTSWTAPPTVSQGPWLTIGAGYGGVIAPDAAGQGVLYYGPDGSTWIWASQWTLLRPPAHPPAQLMQPVAVYDGDTSRVLLFGGEVLSTSGSQLSNQLWSWDGSNWALISGSTASEPAPSSAAVPPVLPPPAASSGPCPYSPGSHPGVGGIQPVCSLRTPPPA